MSHSSGNGLRAGWRRRARLRGVAVAAGVASVALLVLPAQAGWARPASATCCTVTINGPAVTMKVTRKGASVKDTFRGKVGQQVSEVLTDVRTSDDGCVTLTLLNPSGGTVDSGSSCSNGNPAGVGPDTLTVPGTYTVKLQVDTTATGGGKLWVSAPVSVGTTSVNGAADALDVTRVGQGVERSFTAKAGQLLAEVVTNVVTSDDGCVTLTLLNPSGGTVDSGSSCGNGNPAGIGPDTLTVSGTYKVLLQVDTTATGTTKLWVSAPVKIGTVKVNGPAVSMDVTRVGQGVERTFTGTAGQNVSEVVTNVVTSDDGCETLSLLNPSGGTVDSGSSCGNGNPVGIGPDRLAKTGTYTVLYQVDTTATGTGKLRVST